MVRFDSAYYRQHYENPRTAVTSRREMKRRARFIGAWLSYMDLPIRSILDAGCGLGWLRAPLLSQFPKARYVGLESSRYLCRRFGWRYGSLATHRVARPFDLVVCYDVVQYLDDREAASAMANLARLCHGVLYFSALTREDWELYCDQARTDRDVHLRPASWYRSRLSRRFDMLGGGLFMRRGVDLPLWALERLPQRR